MVELKECINFLLSKTELAVHQRFKQILEPHGITPVQCGVLNCLYKEDGLSLKAIADSLALNASTITGIIDRMEEKKFIKRKPDRSDRRSISIFLTDKAKKLEPETVNAITELNSSVMKELTEQEKVTFRRLLRIVTETAS